MLQEQIAERTSTALFLESIEPTIKRGPINNDGYYEYAGFTRNGYTYIITPKDAFITRVVKRLDTKAIISCIAPHKYNKEGTRVRYTFALDDIYCKQVTIEAARLHAALLIPGAFDRLVSDEPCEVNHKATLDNAYTNQIHSTSKKAMILLNKLLNTKNPETGEPLYDRITAEGVIYSQYEDIMFELGRATDFLRRSPRLLRDNRIANLEVCTSKENKAHYRTVQEFIKLATDPIYKANLGFDISLKPIEAEKATAFEEGTLPRDEFIAYAKSLVSLDAKEVEEANLSGKESPYVRELLSKNAFRGLFNL